jgi:hypothetical protein
MWVIRMPLKIYIKCKKLLIKIHILVQIKKRGKKRNKGLIMDYELKSKK